MRRADRLFQTVLLLRKRRAVTARELAGKLEVSERTVYRDVQDLMASGVPIDGEAGVGYRLRKGFELPPLMFTQDELTALRLGARMVRSWSDAELAAGADSALAKIEAVLPDHALHREPALYAPDLSVPEGVRQRVRDLRLAVAEKRAVRLAYRDAAGELTERIVHPLMLFYWGATWTVGAWCELRSDFRDFRLDCIMEATVLQPFVNEPGRTAEDYLARAC